MTMGISSTKSFSDQLIGVHEPKQEVSVERPMEDYHLLVGSRHIDPKNGLTYETVDIKITPNRDIVAWRRRVIKGSLQDTPQGPFHAEDIYTTLGRLLQPTRSSGIKSHLGYLLVCRWPRHMRPMRMLGAGCVEC